MKIQLTEFSKRHFDENFKGTKILDKSPSFIEHSLNTLFNRDSEYFPDEFMGDFPIEYEILDGYADFCKLLVISNFTDAKTGTMEITDSVMSNIRSEYYSRTDSELPVLTTYLDIHSDSIPRAKYLVFVLYSRDQLEKEFKGDRYDELDIDTDYGVVAILGQMTNTEEPMKPITMMRNALGVEEGGSGVPLDREKYMESVRFWSKYITIK